MTTASAFEKLHIPLGSLIVDASLVLFLAFTAGQMTSRFQTMDTRLGEVEANQLRMDFTPRITMIEAKLGTKADKR